jgi:hypothetical protein
VLIKDERIGKSRFKTSRNYGVRETEDPTFPDNPYALFNRGIVSINVVDD